MSDDRNTTEHRDVLQGSRMQLIMAEHHDGQAAKAENNNSKMILVQVNASENASEMRKVLQRLHAGYFLIHLRTECYG